MKILTYHMPGDPIESARNAVIPCRRLSSKINSLDEAEELLHKAISPDASIITYGKYESEMNANNVILEIDGHLICHLRD